jgi:hypothetical protein
VVGEESYGADLDTLGGNILFLELSRDVPLNKSSLAYSTVSDEYYFELCNRFDWLYSKYFTSMLNDLNKYNSQNNL